MKIRIHKILTGSRANGPGTRNVVWLQGCSLSCPGCFNPETHAPDGGTSIATDDLCGRLLDPENPCGGITISGGEPFQQPEALFELLQELRNRNSPPVLVFSGFPHQHLQSSPECRICLPLIDALICGPYQKNEPPAFSRFCSSANQELLLLSDRLCFSDFENLPLGEMIIDSEGNATLSGIDANF